MNTVPANVKAQGDRADALLTAIAKGENPGQVQAPPVEDPAIHKPEEETVDGLKHKLAVLQGKYNSEIQAMKDDVNLLNNLKGQVRGLNGQLREMNGKLQEANALTISLQRQITEKKVDPPVAGGEKDLLTDEDREWLKNEGLEDRFVEIITKVARGEAAKREPAANPGNTDDLENVKRDLHQQKVNTFWKELSDKVADWEAINASDDFNDWLDEKLPYSTKDRRSVLQDAQAQLDYGMVIQLFKDFKESKGFIKQEPVKKSEHVIDPAKQLEPDSTVAHIENPNGTKTEGKIYTRQWIRDFYKDVATGKYKGKEKEAESARIDADIIKANAEGRIRD
jgi:hypothetical protein